MLSGSVEAPRIRWSQVRGPFTGLIALLTYLKWDVSDPEIWFDDRNAMIEVDLCDSKSISKLKGDIQALAIARFWREASTHGAEGEASGISDGVAI